MPEPTPIELVDLLCQDELRIRTGILELSPESLGSESNIAVHLGIGCRDICAWKIDGTPTGRTHLGITWEGIVEILSAQYQI